MLSFEKTKILEKFLLVFLKTLTKFTVGIVPEAATEFLFLLS
jgi:hypothetical protein